MFIFSRSDVFRIYEERKKKRIFITSLKSTKTVFHEDIFRYLILSETRLAIVEQLDLEIIVPAFKSAHFSATIIEQR